MPEDNTIEFSVEGHARHNGHVTLGGFLYQLRNLYEALNLTDRLVTGQPEPTAEYRIIDLRHDSPATVNIAARPKSIREDMTARILDGFVGAMQQIEEFGNAPPWVDRDLLERLRDLNRPVGRTVSHARVRRRGQQVTLSAELRAKIDLILAPEETFEGSVKGDLEAINVHDNNNTFRIYPSAGPGRVTCHFPDNLRDQAISAIDQLVIVHGVLRYKANARFPDEIDVRDIEVVEQPDDLPTLTELRGIARGATGDLTAVEYVRGLRDGWD